MGFFVTDELFGVAVSMPKGVRENRMYGAIIVAATGWELGTVLGVIIGNVLPDTVVGALSVALFGMFIAIIVPPAKKDKVVMFSVIVSFILSFAFSVLPIVKELTEGMRTIILTVIISAVAAYFFPIKERVPEYED